MHASQLRDEGKVDEAVAEFEGLADDTLDPLDKAGLLINAGNTLTSIRKTKLAKEKLDSVLSIIAGLGKADDAVYDRYRLASISILAAYEEANICNAEGRKEEALAKIEMLESRFSAEFRGPDHRGGYEMVRAEHGILLADLGRWKEALPILEEAESFERHRGLIKFYLGHTYIASKAYVEGVEKLKEALAMTLPPELEGRAHCDLGVAYHKLEHYTEAKVEFERYAGRIDSYYMPAAELWHWLDVTCQHLKLWGEAKRYAQLAKTS